MRIIQDFETNLIGSSLSVLLELWTTLGQYRNGMVLIGGWAPYFILKTCQDTDNPFQHVGSIDIDIALNPSIINENTYQSIVELISNRGYQSNLSSNGQPIEFSFLRKFVYPPDGKQYRVQVDFLGPEYGGTGRSHRHQRIRGGLLARKARGCDIVFDHNFQYSLKGALPNGAENTVEIKVADIVGCLTTKGFAIANRYNVKDAYDVYSVVANCSDGPSYAAREVRPYLGVPLIGEAMQNIASKFESIRAIGPAWVADFLYVEGEEREQIMADAFIQVGDFLKALDL